MGEQRIDRFRDAGELAAKVAALWIESARSSRPGEPWSVALSGGRIARSFFDAVAARRAELPKSVLNRAEFFWADERCVPPEHPESNFRLAQENLFEPLGIEPFRVHRIRGEVDKETAAAEAEAEIRAKVRLVEDGQPVLDLVLLGMGEDGHVASLFPGQPVPAASLESVYRGVVGPKPPPARVTLNYAPLRAARLVWVLASGPGKEEALRESLREHGSTPLAKLIQLRSSTRILTDISI